MFAASAMPGAVTVNEEELGKKILRFLLLFLLDFMASTSLSLEHPLLEEEL